MKSYLIVVVLAISVYWFKDSLTDSLKDYFTNDVESDDTKDTQKISQLDRSTKEMSKFIKPKFTPKVQIDKNELKKKLTPIEYYVTQEKGTERPFSGKYVRLNENGMYTCVVCNEELFSSDHKYESGCGWPSFHSIENVSKVVLTPDTSHIGANLLLLLKNKSSDQLRTEVLCANCGSHLGHVFDDGPTETKTRFCINSASLRFKKGDEKQDSNNNEATEKNNEKN